MITTDRNLDIFPCFLKRTKTFECEVVGWGINSSSISIF